MGVFDTATKKISNLLGMTTLGQKAKAAALGVTLASDEDVVKAEDAVHSSGDKGIMALGVRKDSAAALAGADGDYIPLIVDSNGLLHVNIGALLGLTAKGQQVMAASLPVVLPSDQSDVPVSAAQLPAALGQAAMAASLSVVVASDQSEVPVSCDQLAASLGPQFQYEAPCVVMQKMKTAFTVSSSGGSALSSGDTTFVKRMYGSRTVGTPDPNPAALNDLDDTAIVDYFDGADASMDAGYIWIYIPMGGHDSGTDDIRVYDKFFITVTNSLGVSMDVAVYGLVCKPNAIVEDPVASGRGSFQIATATIADAASEQFGNGGTTPTAVCEWPFAYILVRVKPASDPAAGGWTLTGVLSQ